MSKKINVTDANGKQFEVDFRDIVDMTTDMEGTSENFTLEDAEKHSMANYQIPITDSQGKTVDVNKILDEAKSNPSALPKAIDVQFEATHSGQNRNYFIYHSDSMQNDAQSWKAPYAKPFLKNHDSYSEPLGRVIDFLHGRSEFNPDRDTINVTYRITDQDAINKFLDGRYKTMSIGGSVGHVTCSICGKDIVKDGQFKFCGHWKGETYAGQKAFWNGRDIQYKEGSVVNMPADDWAQVKRITVVSDTAGAKDDENMSKPNTTTDATPVVPAVEPVVTNILDDIDALTNETPVVADATPVVPETTEPKVEDETPTEETLETVKTERDTLKDDNEKLTTDKLALEDKVKELEATISGLNDSVTTITEEKNITDEEAKTSRQQSIKLAVMNKKLMAQRVVDFELLSNTLTDAKKDERLGELVSKPAKELADMVEGLATSTIKEVRKVADQVKNPGAVNQDDPNTVTDDNTDNGGTPATTPKVYSMKDFEDTLINVMTRK